MWMLLNSCKSKDCDAIFKLSAHYRQAAGSIRTRASSRRRAASFALPGALTSLGATQLVLLAYAVSDELDQEFV